MHQDLPIAAELTDLRAEIRKLEGIHSDIKCSLGKIQEENTMLRQEKKETQELVHLLQTENHQLQSSKNYLEKIISAKRFSTLQPLSEEECMCSQFKHEKDYRVCARCYKTGQLKSWCQVSNYHVGTQDNSLQIHFYIRKRQKSVESVICQKAQKENKIETIGPSDSGSKNEKQIVCGFMDCMEEENSQPNDTSSTIVEGTKNSMDLAPNDEVVNKSDQEVDSVLNESKVECGSDNTTFEFTSTRVCMDKASIRQRQKRGKITNSRKSFTCLQAKKSLCKAKKFLTK
ncbi:hypothetical protein PTKIN_Ptkin10aG0060400 [Pterospermum kingtungense]